MMTFGSLFSGIGGFDLGLENIGMKCKWQVEIDPFCREVLKKHWPEVKRYGDIKKTSPEPVDLICGGFPCQPFSCAGKQRSKQDDRYLWPEMLRIIQEVSPAWVIGENVLGIINLAFDQVLSDLENAGYTWETFVIPACGINAPHRRDRVFVVAYSDRLRGKGRSMSEKICDKIQPERSGPSFQSEPSSDAEVREGDRGKYGIVDKTVQGGKGHDSASTLGRIPPANSKILHDGQSPSKQGEGQIQQPGKCHVEGNVSDSDFKHGDTRGFDSGEILRWAEREKTEISQGGRNAQPGLGGKNDGLSTWLDGYWNGNWEEGIERTAKTNKYTNKRLKALGNAVIPQIIAFIGLVILEFEKGK